jgi:NAD(P)-dependent dehydrogenase (short-subunit alcohol dehydrogenase family)
MRLTDKVAIVTGGAHGMGEAEARLFAAEGAKVIVADILESEVEIVASDIRAGGAEAMAAKIDVTSESEWMDLIAKVVATYGRLDILVNNAGISGSSVGDPDGLEGWHRIIAVNQTSVFLGTRLAAEQMAKTGGGSIINISSIMGFVGSTSGHPAYHASKGAVRIYSKAAAVRYGPSGVRVNTVHPGYMPPMLNATNAGERAARRAVAFGSVITIEPGAGALAFSAVVILTMCAAETFDPRLMWDAGEASGDARRSGIRGRRPRAHRQPPPALLPKLDSQDQPFPRKLDR